MRTPEQLEADDIASEARAGEARYNGPDYDYDEEMANAEDPCCEECQNPPAPRLNLEEICEGCGHPIHPLCNGGNCDTEKSYPEEN